MESLISDYVDALCKEISWVGSSTHDPLSIHTIFFGGGTPSLLSLGDVEKILATIQEKFNLQSQLEITMEANPVNLPLNYLYGLRNLGVNRLSLGMQSAISSELSLLERQHQNWDVVKAVDYARRVDFDNLNLDLIFGIPYQSLEQWNLTLNLALSLRPDHFSLYSLTLEHGTPLAHWVDRGLVSLPDGDLAADMYELADEKLQRSGFLAYEISNWARIDPFTGAKTCKHNIQYWKTLPYLGFGAGAHGFANNIRTANVLSPKVYIQRLNTRSDSMDQEDSERFPVSPATSTATQVEANTLMGEYMMMGLRLLQDGISEVEFVERFGKSLSECYGSKINILENSGLLEWTDEGRILRLTQRARLLGNLVFREFI